MRYSPTRIRKPFGMSRRWSVGVLLWFAGIILAIAFLAYHNSREVHQPDLEYNDLCATTTSNCAAINTEDFILANFSIDAPPLTEAEVSGLLQKVYRDEALDAVSALKLVNTFAENRNRSVQEDSTLQFLLVEFISSNCASASFGRQLGLVVSKLERDHFAKAAFAWFAMFNEKKVDSRFLLAMAEFFSPREPSLALELITENGTASGVAAGKMVKWRDMLMKRSAEEYEKSQSSYVASGEHITSARAKVAGLLPENIYDRMKRSRYATYLLPKLIRGLFFQSGGLDEAKRLNGVMDYEFRENPELYLGERSQHVLMQCHGEAALFSDDPLMAKNYLLNSINASFKASPVLTTFGPEMWLANELLRRGYREPVLDYLRQCQGFWVLGAPDLAYWIVAIEFGFTPNLLGRR